MDKEGGDELLHECDGVRFLVFVRLFCGSVQLGFSITEGGCGFGYTASISKNRVI